MTDRYEPFDHTPDLDSGAKTPKSLRLGDIVSKWREDGQPTDPRYGRSSNAKEISQYIETTTPKPESKYVQGYKWASRGGFSANKSKYITDAKYNVPDYDKDEIEFEVFKPQEESQERITVTEPQYASAPPLRYQRKSGFGNTTKNIDYSLKYEYNKVDTTPIGRYKEAMDYRAKPQKSWSNMYSRVSQVCN